MRKWMNKMKRRSYLIALAVMVGVISSGSITMEVRAEDGEKVIPCGMPIGIYMQDRWYNGDRNFDGN